VAAVVIVVIVVICSVFYCIIQVDTKFCPPLAARGNHSLYTIHHTTHTTPQVEGLNKKTNLFENKMDAVNEYMKLKVHIHLMP
jgi:hypothetical protein